MKSREKLQSGKPEAIKEREIESSPFDKIRKTDDQNNEYWLAEDLGRILGYEKDSDFAPVINRAKIACGRSGYPPEDHFKEIAETTTDSKGRRKKSDRIRLSRYACYLAILNADPARETVAMGQTYLVMQARAQELQKTAAFNALKTEEQKRLLLRGELSRHNLILASLARKAGIVAPSDFAIFHNHGYMGLYGGLDAKEIRAKKGLPKDENILDHMGSAELSANLLRVKQAGKQLRKLKASSAYEAERIHFEAGQRVRRALIQLGGIAPEELPVVQDIRQIESVSKKGKL